VISSVRGRLTAAVAVLVGGVALAAALIAPNVVEKTLIADRLDAQRDVEVRVRQDEIAAVDARSFDADELSAILAPGIADVTRRLDRVGALDEMRRLSPTRDLNVLAGDGLVAVVSPDGAVRVAIYPDGELPRPVVSWDRLDRLAGEYAAGDEWMAIFETFLADQPALDAVVDDFVRDVVELFDLGPRTSTGPDGPFADQILAELESDLFAELAAERPNVDDLVVETREVAGVPTIVTASVDGIDQSVRRVRDVLWIGLPIAMLLAGALTWLLAGRALRPVAAITEQTRRIRSTTLNERVPVPRSDDEIAELAGEMNHMLERVEREDARRRQFVSDASHELRSPIAAIRVQAEAVLADRDGDTELAGGVLAEAERMGVLVDDLLALARRDEHLDEPGTVVDLDDVVLAAAAAPRRVPVDVSTVSAGQVVGHADELRRAVTHLLDNAARHAASRVVVGLATGDDGSVVVTVDDDGDGVPPDDRERVFERFVRLDDARSRDAGGAGLGLAVVEAAVTASGGDVTIGDAPIGGARFTLRLPPVSSGPSR
jgi:signal transduction histidine kinase